MVLIEEIADLLASQPALAAPSAEPVASTPLDAFPPVWPPRAKDVARPGVNGTVRASRRPSSEGPLAPAGELAPTRADEEPASTQSDSSIFMQARDRFLRARDTDAPLQDLNATALEPRSIPSTFVSTPPSTSASLSTSLFAEASTSIQTPSVLRETGDRVEEDATANALIKTVDEDVPARVLQSSKEPRSPYRDDESDHARDNGSDDGDEFTPAHDYFPDWIAATLEETRRMKEEGNVLFRSKQYRGAIAQYTEALGHMPADCVPLQKDRAVLFHNRAVCYHCLDQTDAVIADATAALQLDPTYTRARAQRMNALAGPGATPPQLQTALADAAAVLAVDANHAAARHVQQTVPERLKRHEQEERDRMLGELKGLGNRILGQFGLSTDHFKFVEQPGGGYALNLQR